MDEKHNKIVQKVIGNCLCYARAADGTILPVVSSIASRQANATEETELSEGSSNFLTIQPRYQMKMFRFHASKMALNVHSDASCLSEPGTRSRVAGIYFMGDVLHDGKPIQLNGNISMYSMWNAEVCCSIRRGN